jgi:alpha-amylase
LVPFNDQSHFHDCGPCPSGCNINDFGNQPQVEWCRLAGLPDLKQENTWVASTLNSWINGLISNYSFDGLRIDTTPEVPKSYWSQFMSAAGVYAVGEIFNGDVGYVSGYKTPKGPLPGVLSYPLFFALRDVFGSQRSMNELQTLNQNYQSQMGDLDLLGTFLDNHDNQRFLYIQKDYQLYKNAIAYTLLSQGIPIIYYGTEQGFSGGNDPNCREALWTTRYNRNTELYQFIQTVVNYRKQNQIWKYPQIQRYSDNNFYAFSRGNTFVALTNGGSNQNQVQETITYHPYTDGTKICNLFNRNSDCLVVSNKQFTVTLANGECKIYFPV